MTALLAHPARRVSLAHCLFDLVDHRLVEEKVDEVRLELFSTPFANGLYRFTEASRRAVSAPMGDGIEAIGDRHDAGLHWNSFSLETARIPFSVPPLVVRGDTASKVGIKRA